MAVKKHLFASGHTACAGCGMVIAVRKILDVLGEDTIVVNATGCLEIVSSAYPRSAWEVPYIHCLFENAPSVASGVVNALRAQGNDHTKVVVLAGDGSTYDIGFGALSGMLERNEDVLYICYDNEAYMNTGNQRSSSTPYHAATTTSPAGSKIHGKQQFKKPIAEIVAAHKVPYVASTSVSYVQDLENKVKKAASIRGAKFISVFTPCVPGWGYESALTVELGELVVESGLWKLFEIENGEFKLNYRPRERKPVKDYFKPQKRFKHLTEEEIEEIQKIIDNEWNKIEEVKMGKPKVDKGKCVSCGLCVNICGDVFKFGGDGKSEVIADADFEANKGCIEELVSGSSKCPVGAISWE